MCSNHSESKPPTQPQSMEKLSSMKPVPGAKKGPGDRCFTSFVALRKLI